MGGIAVARGGLKRWLWPMVWAISLPDFCFMYTSAMHNRIPCCFVNILHLHRTVRIRFSDSQPTCSTSFTFADGEHKTAHYAICTAFYGAWHDDSGNGCRMVQEHLGYNHFFLFWIMICCIATFGVTALLKIHPEFGKKTLKS